MPTLVLVRHGQSLWNLENRFTGWVDVPPPNGESLELTAKRTLPFFDRCIAGDLRLGKNVLVVAHGNSNRSIVMQLDRLTGEQVIALELATGAPLVYEMAQDGTTVKSKRILG